MWGRGGDLRLHTRVSSEAPLEVRSRQATIQTTNQNRNETKTNRNEPSHLIKRDAPRVKQPTREEKSKAKQSKAKQSRNSTIRLLGFVPFPFLHIVLQYNKPPPGLTHPTTPTAPPPPAAPAATASSSASSSFSASCCWAASTRGPRPPP